MNLKMNLKMNPRMNLRTKPKIDIGTKKIVPMKSECFIDFRIAKSLQLSDSTSSLESENTVAEKAACVT